MVAMGLAVTVAAEPLSLAEAMKRAREQGGDVAVAGQRQQARGDLVDDTPFGDHGDSVAIMTSASITLWHDATRKPCQALAPCG